MYVWIPLLKVSHKCHVVMGLPLKSMDKTRNRAHTTSEPWSRTSSSRDTPASSKYHQQSEDSLSDGTSASTHAGVTESVGGTGASNTTPNMRGMGVHRRIRGWLFHITKNRQEANDCSRYKVFQLGYYSKKFWVYFSRILDLNWYFFSSKISCQATGNGRQSTIWLA